MRTEGQFRRLIDDSNISEGWCMTCQTAPRFGTVEADEILKSLFFYDFRENGSIHVVPDDQIL